MSFKLVAKDFGEGQAIPTPFSCEGSDLSPALSWSDPPSGTREFALIMDDPDAPMGTWVHWVLYNVPADRKALPEGLAKQDQVPGIGTHGKNSWGKNSYGGPCPPPGKTHRYFFKLYALSKPLSLPAGVSKEALLRAMQGVILGEAQVMGTFVR
ncbi:MAG: YbhB/YbcL family Raf kinase inhibitor-like protein [bacterium]